MASRASLGNEVPQSPLPTMAQLIQKLCLEQPAEASEDFFERYPRFLLRRLRDQLLQLDKSVRLLESYEEASLTTLEHFFKLKVEAA